MVTSVPKIAIEKHRHSFPGLAGKVYFNFGGQGTMPESASTAIIKTHQYIQQVGPFSLAINAWITRGVNLVRQEIATELGTTSPTITLTENVTAGCNIALWGIDWQPGERILITDCEHPGIMAIVGEISRRFGVEVAICPILDTLNQGDPVAVIAQNLTPQTRLVVFSHLLWNTGQVLPLAEIVKLCHNYNRSDRPTQVLVDAAQSVGSLPLNLGEIQPDYYAFTGHKWLCGPAGVGGLYISPEAFKQLQPTFIGWRGINLDRQGKPASWKDTGEKFEIASSAYPEYEGLKAAILTHRQWGNSLHRYQRICQLSNYLWSSLSKLEHIQCLKDTPPEAGLVSFQVRGNINHGDFVKILEKQGFMLRTIANPNCIRACVHYFTLPEEIDRLVAIIAAIIN